MRRSSPCRTIPRSLATAVASAERVFEVLRLPSPKFDRPGETTAEFTERIEFRGVSFEYEPSDRCCATWTRRAARQVVAIVGPSGAGKTRWSICMAPILEPTRGEILLDGVPLTSYTRTSRGAYGIVSQGNGAAQRPPCWRNIAYGLKDVPLEQVRDAARAANADEFIMRLPRLQHGARRARHPAQRRQRQRIAIARALLRDPPILILGRGPPAHSTPSPSRLRAGGDRPADGTSHRVRDCPPARERFAACRLHRLVLAKGRSWSAAPMPTCSRVTACNRRLYNLQFRT